MKRPSYATSLLCKRCEAGYSITGSRCEHLEVMGFAGSREQANRSTGGRAIHHRGLHSRT